MHHPVSLFQSKDKDALQLINEVEKHQEIQLHNVSSL